MFLLLMLKLLEKWKEQCPLWQWKALFAAIFGIGLTKHIGNDSETLSTITLC